MISLPKLLLEAAGHKASEVVLEVGHRPSMSTPQGRQPFGEPLQESEFFEALTGVLGPEQQAELAVGNMVEFRLSGPTGEWKMVVEPSTTGIVLRGRRAGDLGSSDPDVGMPMDLPPLAPFEPDALGEAPAPEPVLKRRTHADLGLKAYASQEPPWAGEPEPLPPIPEPVPPSDGLSPLPPPPPVADLGPSRESGVDFAIVPDEEHPTLVVPPPGARPPPAPNTPIDGVPKRAKPAAAPTVDIAAGTLTFFRDRALGDATATACGHTVTVLDEPSAVDLGGRMLSELEPGATYLVLLEDPSRLAAWLLRRLEEGSRVFVETRAASLAGAERIFVGLHGEPAVMWLAEHRVDWLQAEDA